MRQASLTFVRCQKDKKKYEQKTSREPVFGAQASTERTDKRHNIMKRFTQEKLILTWSESNAKHLKRMFSNPCFLDNRIDEGLLKEG